MYDTNSVTLWLIGLTIVAIKTLQYVRFVFLTWMSLSAT
jgi:hypothetical protein